MLIESRFKHIYLIDKFFIKSKHPSKSTEICADFLMNKSDISEENKLNIKKELIKSLKYLHLKYFSLLKQNNYKHERVLKKHNKWLNSYFKIPELLFYSTASTSSTPGRPIKEYKYKSKKTQERESLDISRKANNDPFKLLLAAYKAAKKKKLKELSVIIKYLLLSQKNYKNVYDFIINNSKNISKKTPEEALCLVLNSGLSKRQYEDVVEFTKSSNCDVYPSYKSIAKAKLACRPKETVFTEICAEVPIQELLNHTVKRLLLVQNDVIDDLCRNQENLELTLHCSWGMDGCTGFTNYNQKWENVDDDDSSLFATALNPLQLRCNSNTIVWNNIIPQSSRFCRPVCLKFIKETKEIIVNEKKRFDEQIKTLSKYEFKTVSGCILSIKYDLIFSMIDGKVLAAITGTKSSQVCPICKCSPKDFNDIEKIESGYFKSDTNSLSYGIQPLHMWIRCFEMCLHISYRLPFKKWQIRGEHKQLFTKRKNEIRNALKTNLGIIVDQPCANGSGTSNTGNTARTAFTNGEDFSNILGLEFELISRLRTLLIAISSHYPLNLEKLKLFCRQTAEYFIKTYGWFYMPVSLHKLLVHGYEIASYSPFPLGILGEECLEARNKFYKRDRREHARKCNRTVNLMDIFNRAMDSSDPVTLSTRINSKFLNKNKSKLPNEVLQLLQQPSIEEECRGETCIKEDIVPELSLVELNCEM